MVTHHAMTLILIGFSYSLGSLQISLTIFCIHNFSEIFVCVAKACLIIGHFGLAVVAFILLLV
jgi:hypothetical protein